MRPNEIFGRELKGWTQTRQSMLVNYPNDWRHRTRNKPTTNRPGQDRHFAHSRVCPRSFHTAQQCISSLPPCWSQKRQSSQMGREARGAYQMGNELCDTTGVKVPGDICLHLQVSCHGLGKNPGFDTNEWCLYSYTAWLLSHICDNSWRSFQ